MSSSESTPPAAAEVGMVPTSIWSGLLDQTPIAHTTPLPDFVSTPLDGTYAKLDPSLPQWWACRRCADYRPAGGIWKLQFDRGVMRILYDVTGWRSIASYSVSGDRLYLYNDPYCPQEVGEYTWKMKDGELRLNALDDSCSIRLRGENLSNQAWLTCLPANESTSANGRQPMPPGCEPVTEPQVSGVLPDLSVTVNVHPGYARDFVEQPDVYAAANGEEVASPDGIQVAQSDGAIPYGLNLVLWGSGVWVQASTELPFDSIGVQVYGDHTIGWAQVLFDEIVVWRGDTAAIWSHLGRHGGYVEITGFAPGPHTLRIESLGFDYRPVTVAYFGFSDQGGVEVVGP